MKEVFKSIVELLEKAHKEHLTNAEKLEQQNRSLAISHKLKAFGYSIAIETVKGVAELYEEEYNNGWIPVDMEVPPNDNYVMVSFDNYSLPDIARYEEDSEGGAFYPGDEEKSYASFGLFVNAWRPLPEPYQPKGEADDHSKNG